MHVLAYAPWGAQGIIIRVEADIRRGIPGIDISGLAEGAVREARERVRASFRNSGFTFPPDRILINLAPAGLRKDGASLDLPIAISVMAASGMISLPDKLMILGELELSGRVRPVRGVLAAVAAGLKEGITEYVLPLDNAREAAILGQARFFAAASLAEVFHALLVRSETGLLPENTDAELSDEEDPQEGSVLWGDFSEVQGQSRYKRALEIAAAGGHNLLVFGPPGSGKTMLARLFPSIMPPLAGEEAVEVTRIHSLAGQVDSLSGGGLIRDPPFRSPHHSASVEGVLGGGRSIRPGEISLAHLGTLFLDEAPEFRISVLQSLREPLEDHLITIVRAEGPLQLPADFQLILAANSCPCGRLGAAPLGQDLAQDSGCFCSSEEIRRYWRRLGAALLDRIELRVPVNGPQVLVPGQGGEEESALIRQRVQGAWDIQRERFAASPLRRNGRMSPGMIEEHCRLSPKAQEAFGMAARKLGLSGRACHGVLKVGRTIADLAGEELIDTVHILEAVQHRRYGDDPYDILSLDG